MKPSLIPPSARSAGFALCLASATMFTSAAPTPQPDEVQVPAGWDLSATLALFRNLPLFDPSSFPETEGKVFCRFSETRNETQDSISFANTYEFFRKCRDGHFLHLSLQETSQATRPDDPSQPEAETVADARQELAVVPALPPGATEHAEVSSVAAYVLDHRVPLVQSEAGKIAQSLNYTREGKVRPGNYVQPRVTFLQSAGSVAKIRVYGLEALLTEASRAAPGGGQLVQDRVLEISVDASGAAQVALMPLLAPSPQPPQ